MSDTTYDCIVIGAGVTGLICAYELVQQKKKVLLLEARADCGGLLSAYHFDTFHIERYYHHFFSYDQHLLALIRQLDLTEQVTWKKASTGYYYQGQVDNLDTPREIFLYRHLSLLDKFRLGVAVLLIKRMKDFRALDRMTAREWLLRMTGPGVYHNFFEPLLKSKFGSAADQISAAWLCGRLKLRSNRKVSGEELGYFRLGFQTLIDALQREIERTAEIRLGEPVIKIQQTEGGVQGVQTAQATYRSGTVVSTLSPSLVLALADFPADVRRRLEKNKSQSVVCALFGMKKPLIDTYWLNIRSETLPFAVVIEHTNFHDIPEYGGQKMIYVAGYQDGPSDPFYQLAEEEIIERYLHGLEQEFGLERPNILWHRLSKSAAVGPIYTVNFLDNLLPHETGIAGLFIGGMMTSYPERGISASIEQGQKCAALSLTYLDK